MEIDWYWDYGYDDESSKTYYVKEDKCDNGRWVPDEEVAELEKLFEELIRHAAELELENMLLKNNKKEDELEEFKLNAQGNKALGSLRYRNVGKKIKV